MNWRRQGAIHFRAGRSAEAALAFEKALAADPQDAGSLAGLALARLRQGRLEESAAGFEDALRLRPEDADNWLNLGNVEMRRRNPAVAETCYRRALTLAPDLAQAWNNLGNLCLAEGRLKEAEDGFRRALQIDPKNAHAFNNLGNIYQYLGRFEPAESCYRRGLEIHPDDPEVLSNLSQCMRSKGRLGEALAAVDAALRIKPDFAAAHNHRGLILQDQGRIAEALAALETAVHLAPDHPEYCSNRLFVMQYAAGINARTHFEAAREWWRQYFGHCAPGRFPGHDYDPFRRLRIGLVSGDFRSHSVGFFLMPLFVHHDPRQVELYGYAQVRKVDETTERFRKSARGWHSMVGKQATAVAEQIRADGIDILVDLSGHTADNRLDVFALRPAPIQMTWLGYPGTTGSPVIDYRITDASTDPPGQSDAWHSERLLRLANGFLCYQPPEEAPAVAPAPMLCNGCVTFGSFNTLPKLNDGVLQIWTTILREIADARLLIKCKQLADGQTRRQLLGKLNELGADTDRIRIFPKTPSTAEHLALYGQVDIALDPFPYNGTTTTCEALWMGVPVVALRGDRHSGRVGASILTQLGLQDLVADDTAGYVRHATELAADRRRLFVLRTTLRERMHQSPLCNGPLFARSFETALRKIWIDRCRDQMLAATSEMGSRFQPQVWNRFPAQK